MKAKCYIGFTKICLKARYGINGRCKGCRRPLILIIIEVCEIKGKCPVHKVGDRIVIDDPKILVEKTDALCIHALSTIVHYALALEHGADPVKLGLTKPEDRENAYIQCVDPWEPYTSGGTVIFKMRKVE